MSKVIKIDNPVTPALFDEVFIAINGELPNYFTWLDNAFGKAQRLERKNDKGKVVKYPAIYTGKEKEYKSLLPNEAYGNFSYWEIDDYKVNYINRDFQIINAKVGFVVWMNLKNVLGSDELRNLESLKEEFLLFFSALNITRVRLNINGVTEKNENIYKDYNVRQIKDQYLMHPFAGLRFEGDIRYEGWCKKKNIVVDGIDINYKPSLNIELYLQSIRDEFDDLKVEQGNMIIDGGVIL